jgi:DNA-binding XRE family transcriptional regulator
VQAASNVLALVIIRVLAGSRAVAIRYSRAFEQSILWFVQSSSNLGNFELIASQILRALRGKRSQRALAKRLGYRANPITDWENGRRCPTAQEAFRVAAAVGADVGAVFALFHPLSLQGTPGEFELAPWLSALRGSTPIVRIAARAGVSRFAVRRWLNGTAQPRLNEFLTLVDALTGRVHDLVAALVPIEQVPSLSVRHATAVAMRDAAYAAPWSEAVMRVIETKGYDALPTHEPGYIARQLSISVEEESSALDVLQRASSLTLVNGRYEHRDDETIDTRGDAARVTYLLEHWSDVARARIHRRSSADLFAYNVFTVSENDLETARDILRRAFREVRTLAARSQPMERVALLNLQFLTFSEHETDRSEAPPSKPLP